MTDKKIAVIGAGAWGTALAQALAQTEQDIVIWAREADVVDSINTQHENIMFLPTVELRKNITATNDLNEAAQADILLLVTPAQHIRKTMADISPEFLKDKPVVICSKGIEIETGQLLSHVVEESAPEAIVAVLTGPTFASEIGRGLPSAMTLGIKDKDMGKYLQNALATKSLRIYVTNDILGAQIGGAIKNVIAIACGVIEGLEFGESARSALVTRGLAEMSRLASAMGAKKETLMGMCGMGDLMLTCSSMQSRNFSLGVLMGQGKSLKEIMNERQSVTEGVHTAEALIKLAKANAVDMPIAQAVYDCLNGGDTRDIVSRMLERPLN